MKTVSIFFGVLVLSCLGISIGGLLWEDDQIPVGLIPLFLFPAAFFLDYFVKENTYPLRIRKYSTTIGVLCMTFIGYFSIDFLGLPLEVVFVILLFLFILLFAPIVFILPIPPFS